MAYLIKNPNARTTSQGVKGVRGKEKNAISVKQKVHRRPFDGFYYIGEVSKTSIVLESKHLSISDPKDLLDIERLLMATPVVFYCLTITYCKTEEGVYKVLGFSNTTEKLKLEESLLGELVEGTFQSAEKDVNPDEITHRAFLIVPLKQGETFLKYARKHQGILNLNREDIIDIVEYRELVPIEVELTF